MLESKRFKTKGERWKFTNKIAEVCRSVKPRPLPDPLKVPGLKKAPRDPTQCTCCGSIGSASRFNVFDKIGRDWRITVCEACYQIISQELLTSLPTFQCENSAYKVARRRMKLMKPIDTEKKSA
jgi:hypothetical protein